MSKVSANWTGVAVSAQIKLKGDQLSARYVLCPEKIRP